MLSLSQKQQSFFVGMRSTFYRLAMVTGQGLIVILAGYLEQQWNDNGRAWSTTLTLTGIVMAVMAITNLLLSPKEREETKEAKPKRLEFLKVFSSFFEKPGIGWALAFILTYRLGESQLVKMASPFLLDDINAGGLAISTESVGVIYGTAGVIMLSLGGILGGMAISRDGLKKWMLPMMLCLNLPNLLYALLAFSGSQSIVAIVGTVVVEQFGYGFGFAAFLIYLIYVAEGPTKTSHYALATGFMALGMMLPGMISGYIQEWIGYDGFFLWVALASIPSLLLLKAISFPADYGKKTATSDD